MLNKKQSLDFLLILFIFILVGSLPLNLVIHNELFLIIVQTALLIGFIIFANCFIRKSSLVVTKKRLVLRSFLLLIPCFVACFSNYFYLFFNQNDLVNFDANSLDIVLILKAIYVILAAYSEEIIFRKVLLENLTFKNKLKKIIFSAGVFGLCHLTIFLSTFNPVDLINVVYTFGVGIILGFIYEYANSFSFCVVFHVAFNLFNDFLFSEIGTISNFGSFILINVLVSFVIGIYMLLVYIIKFKKEVTNYEEALK